MDFLRRCLVFSAAFAVAGCGSSPDSSRAEPGRTPLPHPFLPPAPSTPTMLSVESVSPESGSSRTIWTIRGAGFSPVPEENVVRFGGAVARIESASETELVVTDAFGPRLSASTVEVVVESRGVTANGPAVTAMPNGTMRAPVAGGHAFRRVDSFATAGDSLWVVDSDLGVFRHTLSTGIIERITSHGDQGAGRIEGVFADPAGTIYAVDVTDIGERRMLRREVATGEWTPVATLSDAVLELVPAEDGYVYVVTEYAVRRFSAGGQFDETFQPVLTGPIGGAAFQWGALFVSHAWNDQILEIDPVTAEVTTFSSNVYAPADLIALGSGLVSVDYHGIREFSADASSLPMQTLPASISPWAPMRLAPVNGAVLIANTADARIFRIDGQSVSLASAGIMDAYGMATVDGNAIVSSVASCFREQGGDLWQGAIFEMSPAAVRVVSTAICAPYGLAPAGGEAVYYARSNDDGSASEVGTLRVSDGVVTVLGTHADGIAFPLIAAGAPDGSVFVANVDFYTGASRIAKIAVDGAVTPDFATAPDWSITYSLAVSGEYLWSSDPAMQQVTRVGLQSGGGLESVPLETPVTVGYDALSADGEGGVYATDAMTLAVVRVGTDGSVGELASLADAMAPTALERDPVDGDVRILDLTASGPVLHAILP